MDLKTIFEKAENGSMSYDEFMAACKEEGIKLADLSKGDYVAKKKFEDELAAKENQITTLNETISQRDTDLAGLKNQLEAAGGDVEKLNQLTNDLSALQTKYTDEVKGYQEKLAKQAYEFAVREFANSKEFTSKAAKRDFINSMIAKELKMDDGKILGADDFVSAYSADNEDAFMVEHFDSEVKEPEATPKFVDSTPGTKTGDENGFKFNFTGVREH